MYSSGVKRRRSSSAYGGAGRGIPTRSSSYGPSGRRYARIGRTVARARAGVSTPVFSETFAATAVAPNTGGVWTGKMADVPELASYSALYRTFRVLKFEVIVMPSSNVNTQFQPTAGANTVASMGRLTHSVDTSAEVTAPAAELNVLEDDSCKISLCDKPIRLSCRPKPSVAVSYAPSGTVGVDLGRANWLSFDDGADVLHNGLPYWYTVDQPYILPSEALIPNLHIYHKITFQCRDPR